MFLCICCKSPVFDFIIFKGFSVFDLNRSIISFFNLPLCQIYVKRFYKINISDFVAIRIFDFAGTVVLFYKMFKSDLNL